MLVFTSESMNADKQISDLEIEIDGSQANQATFLD